MSLTQEQYNNIMKKYDDLQRENHRIHETRRTEVYDRIPEMQQLDDELHTTAINRLRSLLSEDTETPASSKIVDISVRRKALLTKAGYPADYLDPIFSCEACQDTGYIASPSGASEKCHCFKQQELALLYEQSNIQDLLAKENFSTLSYEYCQGEDLERLKRAVGKSLSFVKNFSSEYQNLLFYGTVGTGKSFLSGCIANELLQKGFSVVYFSASGFFETIARYSFDKNEKETLYNFYKQLYNYDCVIVDDLGTELTNSFVATALFTCLNERNLRKKATIISTNLSLEELRDRYSDRVFSRITSNFTICKLTGPDVRMCKRNL